MKHLNKDYQRIQDPAGLIPEDEPVFLIRGNDPAGPILLRIWADLNKTFAGDPVQSINANGHAKDMVNWQQDHAPKKLAEEPVSERQVKQREFVALADRLVKLRVLTVPNEAPSCYLFEEDDFPEGAEKITRNGSLARHLKANCMELGFAIEERMESADATDEWFFCKLTRTENEGTDIISTLNTSVAEAGDYNNASIAACVTALELGKYRWLSVRQRFVTPKKKKGKKL